MGVWNQSVFDPIFASVLLRTGWTVSNQERLYGIGTRFWRYLIVKCSVRCSAEVKSAVSGGCDKKCRVAAPGPLCKSGSKLHALHTLARNPGAPERREAYGVRPACWRFSGVRLMLPDTFNRTRSPETATLSFSSSSFPTLLL